MPFSKDWIDIRKTYKLDTEYMASDEIYNDSGRLHF